MKSTLFYEGQKMGEFDSPVSVSVNYICWDCGRIFAQRICSRPFTWKVHEGVCSKCGYQRGEEKVQDCLVLFHIGAELFDSSDRRELLCFIQFIYEANIAIGPESVSATEQHTLDTPRYSRGFESAEHTWSQGTSHGGFGSR